MSYKKSARFRELAAYSAERWPSLRTTADGKESPEHVQSGVLTTALNDFLNIDHPYHAVSASSPGGSENVDLPSWRDGRRVIELGLLADQLESCDTCGMPLHLINCVSENIYGPIGSVLNVRCQHCSSIRNGYCERHRTSVCGPARFDVITKLGRGKCRTLCCVHNRHI